MTLQAGSSGDDVRELQQQLKSGGYYSGPIDGDYGPDTESAVRAYQSAHGLTVDGVAGAETWGNIHGDPAYPNNSSGSMGGGGGGSGTGLPGGDIDAKIRADYPTLSYLLDNPEVAPILRDAYTSDPPWSATLIQSKIMGTNWWKTNADSARNYYNQQFTDPATFNNKIRDYSDQVKQIGGSLGYDETVLTPEYVSYFANKAYRDGLSPAQIKQAMADEITPLIGSTEKSPILAQIRQSIQDWGLVNRIDTKTLNYWLDEIGSGRQTLDNLRGALQQQTGNLFPNLKDLFEQGMTFRQIVAPYRDQAGQLLETDPNSLDFMGDPKWRHVVDYVDPKTGVHRSMSNQELSQYVKSMPEWNQTHNAVDQYSQIGQTLLQSFGAA